MNIQRLIKQGESDVLEFKVSFGKDVIETLCAFANHRGGTVLIGVADDGKIIGASCGEESMQNWVNEIKHNTTPSIIPDIEMTPVNGKNVVIVHMSEFPIKPVAYRDRYFKRVANSNHRLSLTEIAVYPTMNFDYEESGDGYFVSMNYREQKTVTTPKTTPITTPITTPKTRERLLELIGHNSRMTREELAQQLGIGINGVKQHILKLKKEGVLERIGGNRGGSWRIN
jgi:predicted HTH transcriptional regulator